ncbi:hypothetical protein [Streptomyces asiaticus]|uniref:hypothetical protein n=1 Tax=Streptomyces asiaticus TaxID=114695 RepID=UPI00380AF9ED
MVYVIAAVLTTVIALAAVCGWRHTRRALIGERAARRISEAALVREQRAAAEETEAAEQVLRAAGQVLDAALAQHYQHHKEGDPDA